MELGNIKRHLRSQRLNSRRSTWSNAFASALAPHDDFDATLVAEAIQELGQDPGSELECVYCGEPAATWDHVFNRVMQGEFSGYGHVIRNLVPSCRTCNEKKGKKPWREWLKWLSPPDVEKRITRMEKFLRQGEARKITPDDFKRVAGDEYDRFIKIRGQIFALLDEADNLADTIREKMQTDLLHKS